MTHIDKNSIKHFSVCFLLALIGAYGMAFALGHPSVKNGETRFPTVIGVGSICSLTSSDV